MKWSFIPLVLCSFLVITSCEELNQVVDAVNEDSLTAEDVALGLKEALKRGVGRGTTELSREGGYFDSPYRILLPEEAQKLVEKLDNIPMFRDLEDDIIRKVNAAAEDAAKKAGPIFLSAIREMTIRDAWDILKGTDDAATRYLERQTRGELYEEFQPVILQSLNKVGAVDLWEDAVTTYNKIPLVTPMNPRLDDHVAEEALDGLFIKIEQEEENIRENPAARVTNLLRRVFGAQD